MQTQLQKFNIITAQKVNYPLVNNSPRFATPALKQDVFTKSATSKEIHFGMLDLHKSRILPKIFTELNGVTPESYSKLSKIRSRILSAISKIFVRKGLVSDVLRATKILKDNLDRKYGAGKYVFVSIGQSPAVLAEMLGTMGVETAICPISSLSIESRNIPYEILKNPNLSKYLDYLKKIGVGTEKIKTDDKQYIFTDFCGASGRSLKAFKEVLTSPKCGYNLPNVNFVPLQDLLVPDSLAKTDKSFMEKFIERNILHVALKKYSPIFRLPHYKMHLVEEIRDDTPANPRFNMLKFLTLERIHGENQLCKPN